MPDFTYHARRSDGSLTQGTLNANDRAAAIRQIEGLKCTPIKIEQLGAVSGKKGAAASAKSSSSAPVSAATAEVISGELAKTLPLSQLFLLTEQLAHLLSAGMTLDEALSILEKRLQQPKLQGILRSLHQALVDGRSLSQAMRDFPGIFSSLYVNMVSAGEASGTLPQILRRLVTHLSGVKSLQDRVQQALVYPAILVVVGFILIIVFMTVMVPQLTGFFTSTGQKLPAATQMLLNVNDLLMGYWWLGLAMGGGCYGLWKVAVRSAEGRQIWDRFLWNFPAFGRIPRYRFYAQFSRTLGTLTENGVILLKSLELLEDISGNEWIRLQMVEVRKAVMDGAGLSTALRQQKLFPELLLDMMAVGEQTGRFSETMQMIADVYERELDKQVQLVSSLVPPMVIAVIATIVGLVVYGILSAVFNLTSGLQGKIH